MFIVYIQIMLCSIFRLSVLFVINIQTTLWSAGLVLGIAMMLTLLVLVLITAAVAYLWRRSLSQQAAGMPNSAAWQISAHNQNLVL